MTDYKKTVLMMESIKQYEELSSLLMEILDEFKSTPLGDADIIRLNDELKSMAQEMEELVIRINQYGGKISTS